MEAHKIQETQNKNQKKLKSQQQQSKIANAEEQKIWDKIKNIKGRDIPLENNTELIYKEHLKRTDGKLILRFPPEPNGFLHLGHIRSIVANFETAQRLGGLCYLRFDDTNPEAESQQYIDDIIDSVSWMGYTPYEITYSSDYFQQLYECAVKLIKKGKAFICEQKSEELSQFRNDKKPSPFRNRSIEENLEIFEGMKQGKYEEGKYVLRAKIDFENVNPTLRDPPIYRVKYHPHPRTGSKWCIFPLYDFTHGICDSLQDITHSLCTLEFEIRRELYYWFLDELDLYKPIVFEFSRLNISHNFVSKRKMKKLIEDKLVNDWDDPRLLTIKGLQRRGASPEALKNFITLLNITRTGNENVISYELLEDSLRKYLKTNSEKSIAVLDPVKLVIENLSEEDKIEIALPSGQNLKIQDELLIERKDIQLPSEQKEDFYGIEIGKEVCLKYYGIVKCKDIVQDNGEIRVIVDLISRDDKLRKKIKGQIHWLNPEQTQQIKVRNYEKLFSVPDPQFISNEELKKHTNTSSLTEYKNAFIYSDKNSSQKYCIGQKYQFDRNGYFCIDSDSNLENREIIFNKTVGFYESQKVKQTRK